MTAKSSPVARLPPGLMIRTPLFWAVTASVSLHAGLVAFALWIGPPGGVPGVAPPAILQAMLMPQLPSETSVIATPEPAPFSVPASPEPPPEPVAVNSNLASASPSGTGARDFSFLRVRGQSLRDRSRIGNLWNRQLEEFPVEIDRPVRLEGTIEAQYPPAALGARREESVIAWIVVDERGTASEVQIVEGSEEFAEAVRAALKTARFVPARNNQKPIRFPIALEFRFVTGGNTATATAAAQ